MKTFKGDFDIFVNKIKNNEHFALSRWGDGELMILENKGIDLTQKGDGEFKYDPSSTVHMMMRESMINAYTYKEKDYYIGVACQCCVGKEKFDYMRNLSGQPEENLTWANIFVNSNYKYFLSDLLPALKDKKIILVANTKSKPENLPFKIEQFNPIGTDAWVGNSGLIQKLIMDISKFNVRDYIYIFAAGPLANIMTYELWKYNKNNTYIDIGSTLDKFLGLTVTRQYLLGNPTTLNKTCIWE